MTVDDNRDDPAGLLPKLLINSLGSHHNALSKLCFDVFIDTRSKIKKILNCEIFIGDTN